MQVFIGLHNPDINEQTESDIVVVADSLAKAQTQLAKIVGQPIRWEQTLGEHYANGQSALTDWYVEIREHTVI